MSTRSTILVVEDDAAIRRGLVDALTFAGYRPLECCDGDEAVDATVEGSPDLVLLDVLLPGRDGFEILRDLRRIEPTLPIIMVTAKGAESDRVNGLAGGADDYVVKPFSPKELLARIEAVLRRSAERGSDVCALMLDGRTIDLNRREASVGGERRQLSEREAAIIRYLAVNRDRAVDREELLHRVWGLNPRGITTRTVDMHIARLREKIDGIATATSFIATVRAKGYMLGEGVSVERPRPGRVVP